LGLALALALSLDRILRTGSARGPYALEHLAIAMTLSQRTELLAFIWAVVILVFFSFSTRQEYYTIPAIPLWPCWWERGSSAKSRAPRAVQRDAARSVVAVLFVIGVIGFAAGMFLLSESKAPQPGTDLADLLLKHPRITHFHRTFFDLTPQALGAFRGPLLGAALSVLMGTGLNCIFAAATTRAAPIGRSPS